MTDTIATDPPAPQPPPAPPTPAASPAPSNVSLPTEAFNERIAQAKRAAEADVLKRLGVTDVASAEAAIKAANEAAEKNKTDAQRVTELTAQLAAEKERGDVYEETLKERAQSELAALPEDKRNAVLALAGDDAGAQILALDTLKPTWSGVAPVAPTTTAPVAPATSTAPPRAAPTQAPNAEPDVHQRYLAMRAVNPFKAAQYRRENAAAIHAAETKQQT